MWNNKTEKYFENLKKDCELYAILNEDAGYYYSNKRVLILTPIIILCALLSPAYYIVIKEMEFTEEQTGWVDIAVSSLFFVIGILTGISLLCNYGSRAQIYHSNQQLYDIIIGEINIMTTLNRNKRVRPDIFMTEINMLMGIKKNIDMPKFILKKSGVTKKDLLSRYNKREIEIKSIPPNPRFSPKEELIRKESFLGAIELEEESASELLRDDDIKPEITIDINRKIPGKKKDIRRKYIRNSKIPSPRNIYF